MRITAATVHRRVPRRKARCSRTETSMGVADRGRFSPLAGWGCANSSRGIILSETILPTNTGGLNSRAMPPAHAQTGSAGVCIVKITAQYVVTVITQRVIPCTCGDATAWHRTRSRHNIKTMMQLHHLRYAAQQTQYTRTLLI